MDGQMHPGIPGQKMMGQGQMPPNQLPQDQPMSLPVTQVPPPVQKHLPPMQVKGHVGATYGHRENVAYCAMPVEYMPRLHPSQPCHAAGPSYYGQPMYHSQQVVVNQHAAPPSNQHQSMYFRPGHGVGLAYPKMQGVSSHGWGEYRMRMDQMQMYGPGHLNGNPSPYINPAAGDQFGTPTGLSSLERKQFTGPNHGHGYRGGTLVQQYQPYAVAAAKPNNMGWNSVDPTIHRLVDQTQQHKQSGQLPVEAGFPPRYASALHVPVANVSGQTTAQSYIPGRRLEHFSPGCGSSAMSPSRPTVECMDEFSRSKTQLMGHGATEFSNHHFQMYGPMLSPGNQFRQGAPMHAVNVGDAHQGPYASRSHGSQVFGDAVHPSCQFPNTPRLQSPNFYQFVTPKCEPSVVGQCYGQESSMSVGCAVVSSTAQSQTCRETPDLSETEKHLISGPVAINFSGAPTSMIWSSAAAENARLVLTSSLERMTCTISSSSAPKSNDTNELSRQNTFDRTSGTSCGSSSFSAVSSGNLLLTSAAGIVVDHRKVTASGSEFVSAAASTSISNSPGQNIVLASTANAACGGIVVTQTASTSTTYAMTTCTAALVSKQCTLSTAVSEPSASLLLRNTPVTPVFDKLQSNFFQSAEQKLNLDAECVKPDNSSPSKQPGLLVSSTPLPSKLDVELANKTELVTCQPHQKSVRAKRKKVKLKAGGRPDLSSSYAEDFPKTEAGLISIKLEEAGDTIPSRLGSFSFSNLETPVKQTPNTLSKEPCLDGRNHDASASTTPSVGVPSSGVPKAAPPDVKDSSGRRTVTVPFGWKRKLVEGRVVYLSPTDVELDSLDQIRHYLMSEGTCKCGLQCPLVVDQVFVFDPDIDSRHLCANDVRCDLDMTNLCNHKRKIIAVATFQHSTGLQMNLMDGTHFRTTASAVVPSVGSDSKCESFPGKLSSPNVGLFVSTTPRPQQGGSFGSAAGAYVRPTLLERRSEDGIGGSDGNGSWPSVLSSGGAIHGSKAGSMNEGSYPMGFYGRPSETIGRADQNPDLSASSPNVNRSPGCFIGESSGYRMAMPNSGSVMGGLMPHTGPQRGPMIYPQNRLLWPPFEENRFSTPYFNRPGNFGMPFQAKLCTGDNVWSSRQPTSTNRFVQAYGNFDAAAFDEPTDMEIQGPVGSVEPWCSSKYTPSGVKPARKARKKVGKKEKPYSSILEKSMPCPNIDVRQIIQEQQERIQGEALNAGGSCQPYANNSADNLTTFLAHQTVLVNRTLPGGLGCTSPAADSDVTQSASTFCSSTDDVASCSALSHSSPVADKTLPSVAPVGDKPICDDALKRFNSPAEMSTDSAHSGGVSPAASQMSLPQVCQTAADFTTSALAGESSCREKLAGASSCSESIVSNAVSNCCAVRNPDPSSFNQYVESKSVGVPVGLFGSELSRAQSHPMKNLPISFSESFSQNRFSSPGTAPHQLAPNPCHSNHWYGDIASTWLYTNPAHSKSPYLFPSGGKRSVASSSGDGCSNVFSNPHGMSSADRSSELAVSEGGLAPENCGNFGSALPTCLPGIGPTSETFPHFPDVGRVTGSSISHQSSTETRELYLCGQPGSGCSSVVESPIALVQNMVSGLVTTQNSLAMVTSMIVNQSETSRRRKSGSSSDHTRTSISHGVIAAGFNAEPKIGDDVVVSPATTSACMDVAPTTCTDGLAVESCPLSSSSAESSCSELLGSSGHQVPMTAVTDVAQVIPTAGIQPSFGHPLHVPPIVQVINPLNIALPGTQILLNDQVLSFGGQDQALLQQGLAMPTVGQLHIAPHGPPQSQMVVFPAGQGTAMVAIQPSQSALVSEIPVEGGGGQVEEEEVGGSEEGAESEQTETDDLMRTTGTQTSTPASSFSNCNSLDSGENELDNSEVLCPDQSVSSSTREDGIVVKDGCARRATRRAAQPTMASILQQGQMSTTQVVVVPSVPQQSFVLPQGVAFAGALGSQGYLQLQQPVDFGFNPSQVGLIHFGQITAAGGLIPTQALVGTMSVAGGGVVSTLAAEHSGATQNLSSKPDPGAQPAFGATEILHLVSPNVPQGHILVQNMPTFAPFAGAILPVVPQAALGTAICNFGGTQTIFAMSQGSLGIMTSVGASAVQPLPSSDRLFGEALPEAPDSTVDSEDAISSNVAESESVVTSTDVHQAAAETCGSGEQVVASASRPVSDLDGSQAEESPENGTRMSESAIDLTDKSASKADRIDVSDDGMSGEEANSHVRPGPSYGLSVNQSSGTAPTKLMRRRKKKKLKLQNRRRHIRTFVGSPSGNFIAQTTGFPLKSDDLEEEDVTLDAGIKCGGGSPPPAESATSERTGDEADEFSGEFSKSQEFPLKSSAASASTECHVTTSASCDYGDSSVCRMQRPRASRLRAKAERTRTEQLSYSKCNTAMKRSLDEEIGKDSRPQDADDADSTTSLPSINYPRSFNMGDLVWGPARGFPSWPGKLVPETEVRGNPKTENGKIWVKWFGDHTFTQAEPEQLKTLSEGLETHHNARKKHRKGRRMNAKLEAAIQEAMVELDRQMVEQSKQNLSSASLPNKVTPVRHWGSRRTKK